MFSVYHIYVFPVNAVLSYINNATYFMWQSLYLLLLFQKLHVSTKPMIIRCLFMQEIKTQGKNLNVLFTFSFKVSYKQTPHEDKLGRNM